jgi:hypothetical protein
MYDQASQRVRFHGVPIALIQAQADAVGLPLLPYPNSAATFEKVFVRSLLFCLAVATGWSGRVALVGKGQQAIEGAFRRILSRLPLPVKEVHPDNSSEFFHRLAH